MTEWKVKVDVVNGTVDFVGLEEPPTQLVRVTRHEQFMVVKVAGRSVFSGRGQQRYAPAKFRLCRLISRADFYPDAPTLSLLVEIVADWPVRLDSVAADVLSLWELPVGPIS